MVSSRSIRSHIAEGMVSHPYIASSLIMISVGLILTPIEILFKSYFERSSWQSSLITAAWICIMGFSWIVPFLILYYKNLERKRDPSEPLNKDL